METIIRQATLDDKDAIWNFIKKVYEKEQTDSSKYKIPERWNWQFIDNPYIVEEKNNLPIWLAIKNNKIIGQMCAFSTKMKIGNKIYNCGWGCDFIVDTDYRGEGIGYKLNKVYYEHYQLTIHISMAYSTRYIWNKCGSISLPTMYIYFYPVKMNKAFIYDYFNNRSKNNKRNNRIFNILCKFFFFHISIYILTNIMIEMRNFYYLKLFKKVKSNIKIKELLFLNDDFEEFIKSTYNEYEAIVIRESKLLNWKYFNNKFLKYNMFIAEENEKIKGYIILRKPHKAELNIGLIADFFVKKDDIDVFKTLINHAIKFFGKEVSAIQCFTSIKNFREYLLKFGFIREKRMDPLMLSANDLLKEEFKNYSDKCFFTFADHDLDQIRFL